MLVDVRPPTRKIYEIPVLNPVTILGLVAATCTTLAFLPQVIKNWKTKSVGDLSYQTFLLFTVGTVLWLTYGILIVNIPIIAANAVTLTFTVANLVQIAVYGRQA